MMRHAVLTMFFVSLLLSLPDRPRRRSPGFEHVKARVEFMRAVDENAVGELKRAARPVTSPEAFDVRADARDE